MSNGRHPTAVTAPSAGRAAGAKPARAKQGKLKTTASRQPAMTFPATMVPIVAPLRIITL